MGNRGRGRRGSSGREYRRPVPGRRPRVRCPPGRSGGSWPARSGDGGAGPPWGDPLLVLVALLIALVLKTFLVQAFVIPSGSMEQTIRIGDRVLVDKLTPWFGSRPERGDVVVFKDPGRWLNQENVGKKESPVVVKQAKEVLTFIGLLPSDDEQDLIKRVIAVGGDTVECCGKDGRISVNGVPLDEPYLYPGNPPPSSNSR